GRNGEDADIEEERRLFYVAITRAQKELFFSFARSRYKFGEEKPGIRSRFLDEVDPGVVRNENGSTINQRQDSLNHARTGTFVEYDYKKPVSNGYPSRGTSKERKIPQPASTPPSNIQRIVYDDSVSELRVGMFVEHEKFGQGKIINKEGQGADT